MQWEPRLLKRMVFLANISEMGMGNVFHIISLLVAWHGGGIVSCCS